MPSMDKCNAMLTVGATLIANARPAHEGGSD